MRRFRRNRLDIPADRSIHTANDFIETVIEKYLGATAPAKRRRKEAVGAAR